MTIAMKHFLVLLAILILAASPARAQVMPVTTSSADAREHFDQGRDRMSHADFAAARSHFDAALAADPGFGLAHLYRAIAGADGRDDHMRQAAAARVSAGERQFVDAWAAHLAEDHERELGIMTGLAADYPDDPNPSFYMGWEYLNLDRHADATAALERTLAIDPTFGGAYNLLGYTAIAADDDAAAERAFRNYMRVSPEEANPFDSYGEFLLINGRFDEARPQFERAWAIDPNFTVSRDNLVRITILGLVDAYERAMRAGDGAAITALHHANAMILPSDQPAVQGRAALATYFAAEYAQPSGVDLESTNIVVAPSGDMAFDIGTTSWQGGTGKYLTVYRKVGDDWLIVADTWNRDAPAATVAAGSE